MINLLRKIKKTLNKNQFSSKDYWESRYKNGGNSGSGSYGHLAQFKAKMLNEFAKRNNILSVTEFGCGDGNQLSLAEYSKYIGLDVSVTAIRNCKERFKSDHSKSFFIYHDQGFLDNHGIFKSELSLSLDVLYHLVEPSIYENYLIHLFASAERFVIIYSTNENITEKSVGMHEKHRAFTDDIDRLIKGWLLIETIENPHKPENWQDEDGSIANFYFYKKCD